MEHIGAPLHSDCAPTQLLANPQPAAFRQETEPPPRPQPIRRWPTASNTESELPAREEIAHTAAGPSGSGLQAFREAAGLECHRTSWVENCPECLVYSPWVWTGFAEPDSAERGFADLRFAEPPARTKRQYAKAGECKCNLLRPRVPPDQPTSILLPSLPLKAQRPVPETILTNPGRRVIVSPSASVEVRNQCSSPVSKC